MPLLDDYEFFRNGIGLLPARGSKAKGSAIWVQLPSGSPMRTCTCDLCKAAKKKKQRKTCDSLRALGQGLRLYEKRFGPSGWQRHFERTTWYRLAHAIFAASQVPCADVRVVRTEGTAESEPGAESGAQSGAMVHFVGPKGEELAQLHDDGLVGTAFLERAGKVRSGEIYINRAEVLDRLRMFQLTDQERTFEKAGMSSGRQSWDKSFWNRLAYHGAREYIDPETGRARGTFHPAIDKTTGEFTLTHRLEDGRPTFRLNIPRKRVEAVLKLLSERYPEQEDLQIHPVPLRSLFQVTADTDIDMRVRPVIRLMQQSGEAKFLEKDKRFIYGNLIFIKQLGVLAALEKDRNPRKFTAPKTLKLTRSQIPSFLSEHGDALADGSLVLEEPLQGLKLLRKYDRVEVDGEPVPGERNWYYLSVRYHFGDVSVSLAEILKSKRQGVPYLETDGGWVDLKAPIFDELERFLDTPGDEEEPSEGVKMSIGELLRFQASAEQPLEVAAPQERGAWLRRLLDREPPEPYAAPEGFKSKLRDYQKVGVDWLRFLGEQGLGGLLCDDMGLGKTHQSMALMACLAAAEPDEGPFLVVAPTSVVSHWRDKIQRFAPRLRPRVYHGLQRSLERDLTRRHVVLTSYGVLRNDIAKLKRYRWTAAVFDEVQYLKNRGTRAYQAASQLPVPVKIGLTGTPIENSLAELKSLFDLVVPGYLGSDAEFRERFDVAADKANLPEERARLARLRRQIQPFVLRRLKSTVLDELPEKIEDVRTCELSPEQVTLYRQAIAGRGKELVAQLKNSDEQLPYLHVFALLDLLKQICNHPALVTGDLDPSTHASGKWDLFCQILQEALDGGEKIVVFSQYLGMLEMMSKHLEAADVDHVRLVGSTPAAQRGDLIKRFNEEADCRVFLGSLRAGGTGIDLVGGSVVIHYDRWWNAAREDQATDRVHRMGQKNVVQVFKLVSEGTLEEKIARMIENKRDLLDEVVQEDDPRMSKIFSRADLLDLLQEI